MTALLSMTNFGELQSATTEGSPKEAPEIVTLATGNAHETPDSLLRDDASSQDTRNQNIVLNMISPATVFIYFLGKYNSWRCWI